LSDTFEQDVIDAQEVFLKNLGTIDRIIAFVARTNRLNPTAAEEFGAEVKLALVTDDYDIIRKFEGRSSFSTYLTTVIQRLFYQHRVKEWGKWRPSAEARRLGERAITLERLLTRDGFSFGEACRFLTTGSHPDYTLAELEAIYIRLPTRQPRPMLVAEDSSSESVADAAHADDALLGRERQRIARIAASVLDRELASLDADDQLILRLRFWHAQKAKEIAETLHMEPKKVYKRIDKLLLTLRRELERAGIRRSDVDELLGDSEQAIAFEDERGRFADAEPGGKTDATSLSSPDGIGGGAGRLPG
jgi:RNA polymerase sigma factor (sigma-70 family)